MFTIKAYLKENRKTRPNIGPKTPRSSESKSPKKELEDGKRYIAENKGRGPEYIKYKYKPK